MTVRSEPGAPGGKRVVHWHKVKQPLSTGLHGKETIVVDAPFTEWLGGAFLQQHGTVTEVCGA